MRRLLLPVALLAALVAILALKPASRERAEPRRGAATPEEAVAREHAQASAALEGASADAAPEETGARVHGMVTGPAGALWCARVVAYRNGTDDVLAEAFTNPEGRYTLAVEGSDFDLAVEPAYGVWIDPPPRRAIVVNEGDDREENFVLGASAAINGRVVDAEGKGRAGVTVLGVRPEHAPPDDAHPNAVLGRAVARCRTREEGGFRVGGFPAGTYRLVIGDPSWTLTAPASASTDGPEPVLTIVAAIAVDLEARDIETREPVEAFSAKVTQGDRVVLEGRGVAGVFSRRVPSNEAGGAHVEITAPGFVPWGPSTPSRARRVAWLVPLGEPNTMIRVLFDDGRPYRGGVRVLFVGKDERSPTSGPEVSFLIARNGSSLLFERTEDGSYRGAMPLGRWLLRVVPEDVLGAPRQGGEVDVTKGRDAEARFVLPAGGELTLVPPPGAALWVCIEAQGEADGSQRSATVEVLAGGRRIEGIPPGLCRLGYPKTTWTVDPGMAKLVGAATDRIATHTVEWFRDVRVVAGGAEEIRLPPP